VHALVYLHGGGNKLEKFAHHTALGKMERLLARIPVRIFPHKDDAHKQQPGNEDREV
jgi:hypothetical protein